MRIRFFTCLTATLFAFPAFLLAEEVAFAPACKEDIQRLCKKVKPGEGRVAKCLNDNEAKITVGCKDSLSEIAESREIYAKVKSFRLACKADLQTFCEGVQKGKGRQVKCLRSQSDKLAAPCRAALETEGMILEPMKAEAPTAPAAPAPSMGSAGTTTTTTTTAAPAAPAAPEAKK